MKNLLITYFIMWFIVWATLFIEAYAGVNAVVPYGWSIAFWILLGTVIFKELTN